MCLIHSISLDFMTKSHCFFVLFLFLFLFLFCFFVPSELHISPDMPLNLSLVLTW